MKKILFWNVDSQKDFVNPNGKLYVKDAEKIKPTLKSLTELAKEHGLKVINTADYHDENSQEISSTPDFITKFPEHCMKDEEGAEFIEETVPEDNIYVIDWEDEQISISSVISERNIVILKDKFDVFEGNVNTERVLEILNPDLVIVYGVAGDYCVDYAIKGLVKRNYNVVAVVDAIQSIKETPLHAWLGLGVALVSINNLRSLLNICD
jgi:nicotinamidase/pyrazinamidase